MQEAARQSCGSVHDAMRSCCAVQDEACVRRARALWPGGRMRRSCLWGLLTTTCGCMGRRLRALLWPWRADRPVRSRLAVLICNPLYVRLPSAASRGQCSTTSSNTRRKASFCVSAVIHCHAEQCTGAHVKQLQALHARIHGYITASSTHRTVDYRAPCANRTKAHHSTHMPSGAWISLDVGLARGSGCLCPAGLGKPAVAPAPIAVL